MSKWGQSVATRSLKPRPEESPLPRQPLGGQAPSYAAFLSYSHRDSAMADWLHDQIERFRVPAALVGRRTGRTLVGERLGKVFRDRQELAAARDLTEEIDEALARSRALIVLCSPAAATSRWTQAEIERFMAHHPRGTVLAAIIAGEPFASDAPGREAEECFPPALRVRYDRHGRPTTERAEPLAADLREGRDGRRLGLLKLIAGLLGVGLDDLVQREAQRRQRRMTYIAAASLAGMALTSGLSLFAFDQRDAARDERREAEGLVEFMLGDLRGELEPIGRLDALDQVGARALAYFERQDKKGLSDDQLSQRSKALGLLGQIAIARGDLAAADKRYREALAGASELAERSPDDPERLFDQAQNVFWLGEIANRRTDPAAAERQFRDYRRLAEKMVALDPDNARWQLELSYASANIGIVQMTKRDFSAATQSFRAAVEAIARQAERPSAASDARDAHADALAWLADAELANGRIAQAFAARRAQVDRLEARLAAGDKDVAIRSRLVTARQGLSRLAFAMGDGRGALELANGAGEEADALVAIEPKNRDWQDQRDSARLSEAEMLVALRRWQQAAAILSETCAAADGAASPPTPRERECAIIEARLALRQGHADQAMARLRRAAPLAFATAPDAVTASYLAAETDRLAGDVLARQGQRAQARDAWQRGLARLPAGRAERPWEMAERATLLERLGRAAAAVPIRRQLAAAGYRPPE